MKYPMRLHTLFTIVLTLVAAMSIAEVSHATASATYDPATGEIAVSVTAVSNWYVTSASESMTGSAAGADSLPLAGGFLSDSDIRIGEWLPGGNFSYNVDLGAVAATDLPEGDGLPGLLADFDNNNQVNGADFIEWQRDLFDAVNLGNWEDEFGETRIPTDLVIWWNGPGFGQPLENQPVAYLSDVTANLSAVPEPGALGLLTLAGLFGWSRRSLGGRCRR